MEGLVGIEPTTTYLRGRCSDQLSYKPVFGGPTVSRTLIPCVQGRSNSRYTISPNCKWWLTMDSNHQSFVRSEKVYPLA